MHGGSEALSGPRRSIDRRTEAAGPAPEAATERICVASRCGGGDISPHHTIILTQTGSALCRLHAPHLRRLVMLRLPIVCVGTLASDASPAVLDLERCAEVAASPPQLLQTQTESIAATAQGSTDPEDLMAQVEALRKENERVQREIAETEASKGKRRSNGAAAADTAATTETASSPPAAPSAAAGGAPAWQLASDGTA